jgi:hypothetical protein
MKFIFDYLILPPATVVADLLAGVLLLYTSWGGILGLRADVLRVCEAANCAGLGRV